jgi:hypothetical protein
MFAEHQSGCQSENAHEEAKIEISRDAEYMLATLSCSLMCVEKRITYRNTELNESLTEVLADKDHFALVLLSGA